MQDCISLPTSVMQSFIGWVMRKESDQATVRFRLAIFDLVKQDRTGVVISRILRECKGDDRRLFEELVRVQNTAGVDPARAAWLPPTVEGLDPTRREGLSLAELKQYFADVLGAREVAMTDAAKSFIAEKRLAGGPTGGPKFVTLSQKTGDLLRLTPGSERG